jgi:hypothetical protein
MDIGEQVKGEAMFDNAVAWGERDASRQGGLSAEGASSFVDHHGAPSDRQRGRLVLCGQLDEVGLDDLMTSLRSRGKNCIVEVRSAARRGEIAIERGRVTRARADGLPLNADTDAAIAAMRGFYRAVFDVLMLDERSPPSTIPPPSGVPVPSSRPASSASWSAVRPPPVPVPDGDATEVALAAAVMNACGVYTRKWLGARVATNIMLTAWARIGAQHPALESFRISSDGMVSVSGIERAKSAIPRAVAYWVFAVFDSGAMFNSSRFQRIFVPEMLGGLMRLLDKGGWGEAFREGGIR